jgi:hypothetical protein
MTDNTACKSCNGSGTSYTGKHPCAFCDGSGLRLKPRFRAVCECGERQLRWTTAYTSNQWMYKHIVAAHRYDGGDA